MSRRTMEAFVPLLILVSSLAADGAEPAGRTYRVSDEERPVVPASANMEAPDNEECEHCRHHRHDIDSHRRAGCPRRVAWYAHCSVTPKYVGDYVGGDTAWFGCGRGPEDGTWGVDYVGGLFNRLVWLNWSNGARHQGGIGAYTTDGPHVLKSIREKRAERHE